jgi:hypothetical protein
MNVKIVRVITVLGLNLERHDGLLAILCARDSKCEFKEHRPRRKFVIASGTFVPSSRYDRMNVLEIQALLDVAVHAVREEQSLGWRAGSAVDDVQHLAGAAAERDAVRIHGHDVGRVGRG